jgi:hypothetical protein
VKIKSFRVSHARASSLAVILAYWGFCERLDENRGANGPTHLSKTRAHFAQRTSRL